MNVIADDITRTPNLIKVIRFYYFYSYFLSIGNTLTAGRFLYLFLAYELVLFKNRYDAADKLSKRLEKYRRTESVVLAIPRGGLEIGVIVSENLGAPLDIVLTKKIGHPVNPEYAIGAVSLDKEIVNSREGIPEEYVKRETKKVQRLLKKRYELYRGGKKPLSLRDKNVILVDDGMATGSTILVAIEFIRKEKPKKIIVAVPVSHTEALERVKKKADEVICLYSAWDFVAVGQFYQEFEQVSDEDAIRLLRKSERNTHD